MFLQTRQAFTPEEINRDCYVDVNANKAVFDSLRNNPKVHYDGKRFSYKVIFKSVYIRTLWFRILRIIGQMVISG